MTPAHQIYFMNKLNFYDLFLESILVCIMHEACYEKSNVGY